jgi:hypothetical protein
MVDEETILSLRKRCDGYYFKVCLPIVLIKENLGHNLLKVVLFAYRLYLFQIFDVLLHLLDITFVLPPKHIGLTLASDHNRNY